MISDFNWILLTLFEWRRRLSIHLCWSHVSWSGMACLIHFGVFQYSKSLSLPGIALIVSMEAGGHLVFLFLFFFFFLWSYFFNEFTAMQSTILEGIIEFIIASEDLWSELDGAFQGGRCISWFVLIVLQILALGRFFFLSFFFFFLHQRHSTWNHFLCLTLLYLAIAL